MTTAIRARPTTYNGIEMRSRLEARVAAFLDSCAIKWEYEPRAFASGRQQYLPDFRFSAYVPFNGDDAPVYIEVKPSKVDDSRAIFEQMRVINASEPDAIRVLICAGSLESSGLIELEYPNGSYRMAFFVSCPVCSWISLGVMITPERAYNEADTAQFILFWCPLCDQERLAGLANVKPMPEWDA